MKVRTSRTILFWLAVFFLGGTILLAATGDAEAGKELPAQLAAWGSIGLLLFAGWWFKVRPRRELHRDEASALRLRSAPGDPLGFSSRPFRLLGQVASAKDIENTSWGTWRGMDVAVFDYWFARSSDPPVQDVEPFTCASTAVPVDWPRISIVPEGLGSRVARSVGDRDIGFELEAFNRAFDVRSGDRRFAAALIDARMMAWLLKLPPGTGFEIIDGTLLCRTPRRADRDLTWALEMLASFLDRISPVVGSLFGRAR